MDTHIITVAIPAAKDFAAVLAKVNQTPLRKLDPHTDTYVTVMAEVRPRQSEAIEIEFKADKRAATSIFAMFRDALGFSHARITVSYRPGSSKQQAA